MANVNTVNNVIEQIDDLRHNCRNRQLRQQAADAAGAHILTGLFCTALCHKIRLLHESFL